MLKKEEEEEEEKKKKRREKGVTEPCIPSILPRFIPKCTRSDN